MRMLMIHADKFSYSVTGQAGDAGALRELDDAAARGEVEEVLVAFMTVERGDAADTADVARQAAETISATAAKVSADRVMVYPYAHLSSDVAKPRVAVAVMDDVVARLRDEPDRAVHTAPFGHYKSFVVACKGHPLSELAVTLTPSGGGDEGDDAGESRALVAERTLRSEWRVYQPDGSFVLAADFDFGGDEELGDLFGYEQSGSRAAEDAPPHIRLMREQELVDYEPASDTGNLRWYPRGLVVKRLLERHVTEMVVGYGAMEVETPIMYDYAHPALAKYLDRFPARQYTVMSDEKEYFLRFAACFGQYMIMRDMVASYRDLPVRLYELTHFSFRREQGGEVAGLRRLRGFTMPDMHSVVRDMSMAKSEFLAQVRLCLDYVDDIGIECVPAVRFVRSFLDENPEFIADLMRTLGRPALVEVWGERFFYFVAKFELNFIDTAKKAACLSTVQIDVENAERFDISYVGEDGARHQPLLLHTSVSGSVDRNLYAILESQAMRMADGAKAEWPVWLAPTQVRVLPVADDHVAGALDLAARIPARVEVDDRNLKLGKKVREAEREWVPYVVVVGDAELSGGDLTVRPRVGEPEKMSVEAFLVRLAAETRDRPFLPANSPRRLSKRPVYVG